MSDDLGKVIDDRLDYIHRMSSLFCVRKIRLRQIC